ncbi:MAG: AAA family ATPase [Bacteroidota bacterium]
MESLYQSSSQKISSVNLDFSRYALSEFDWSQRLIGVTGARGVGKTTLLLQLSATKYPLSDTVLYVSLDELYFSANTLSNLVDSFMKTGGKCIVLDEVHKYITWSQEIKNIYDRYSDLQIIFTASAALEIYKGNADLSRRALHYRLHGMSFREFVELNYSINIRKFSLNDIIYKTNEVTNEIVAKLKIPIKYFKEYLVNGVYPFSKSDKVYYHQRLINIFNQVLETDLPSVYGIDYKSIVSLKKLIYILSDLVPYKPNISGLSQKVGVSRETIIRYLYFLQKADILLLLYSDKQGITLMNKPEKIYLNNTNLSYALSTNNSNIGAIRETFFMNQISCIHNVEYTNNGDFFVDGKYTFEIGGKNKTQKQIKAIDNAFIVKDDIEYGHNNIIPLYLFGFLY